MADPQKWNSQADACVKPGEVHGLATRVAGPAKLAIVVMLVFLALMFFIGGRDYDAFCALITATPEGPTVVVRFEFGASATDIEAARSNALGDPRLKAVEFLTPIQTQAEAEAAFEGQDAIIELPPEFGATLRLYLGEGTPIEAIVDDYGDIPGRQRMSWSSEREPVSPGDRLIFAGRLGVPFGDRSDIAPILDVAPHDANQAIQTIVEGHPDPNAMSIAATRIELAIADHCTPG